MTYEELKEEIDDGKYGNRIYANDMLAADIELMLFHEFGFEEDRARYLIHCAEDQPYVDDPESLNYMAYELGKIVAGFQQV